MVKRLSSFEIHRREKNLTLTELAKEMGIAPSLVQQVEAGQRKPWPKFKREAARILAVSEERLFGKKDEDFRS